MDPVRNIPPDSNVSPSIPTTSSSNFWSRLITSCSTNPQLESSAVDPSLRVNTSTQRFAPTWQQELAQWVSEAPENERANREIASQRITDCIGFFKFKFSLDLSKLGLTSLPPVLQHCNWLQKLDCSYNALTTLILHDMPALKEFDCSHNSSPISINLNNLPQFISNEFQVTGLNLIELRLNNLPKLEIFTYRRRCSSPTSLTTLEIQNLPSLTFIDCSFNNITALTLNDLPSLGGLTLVRCSLTTIRLNGLKKINGIQFGYNDQLRWTEELGEALTQMPDLNYLSLGGTQIYWMDLPEKIRFNPYINIDIRPTDTHDQNFNIPQNIPNDLDLKNNLVSIVKNIISRAQHLNQKSDHITKLEQKLTEFSSASAPITQRMIDHLFRAASLITHPDMVKDEQLDSYFKEMNNLKDIFASQTAGESEFS